MSNGFRNGRPPSDLAGLIIELEQISERLDTLERPSGEQLAQVVAELTLLVSDIQNQLDIYNASRYTNAQINSLVASPGNISPGSVSGSGNLTMAGEVRLPNVPVTILSSAYFATYGSTNDGGRIGHVPSSLQYKTLLGDYVVDLEAWVELGRLTKLFYYNDDEAQSPRAGMIAEWVNERFPEFVIHVDGEPRGIHYEFMVTGMVSAFTQFVDEVRARESRLEARLTALESSSKR